MSTYDEETKDIRREIVRLQLAVNDLVSRLSESEAYSFQRYYDTLTDENIDIILSDFDNNLLSSLSG